MSGHQTWKSGSKPRRRIDDDVRKGRRCPFAPGEILKMSLNLRAGTSVYPSLADCSARSEQQRRVLVNMILGIYWLTITEGALRKWLLPDGPTSSFLSRIRL